MKSKSMESIMKTIFFISATVSIIAIVLICILYLLEEYPLLLNTD